MSNVDVPPDPYFPNIIFNPEYFVASTGGGDISKSYANAHYLQSFTGDNAISDANSTKFNNNVGIGTAAAVSNKLIINGSCKIINGGIDLATDVVTNSPIYLSLNGGSCIGCANAAAQFSTSAIAGDTVLRGKTGNKLLLLSGSGAAAASIIDSGTVGIGTTNPNTNCKLTVEGKTTIGTGSSIYNNIYSINGAGLIIADTGNNGVTGVPQQLVIGDTANTNTALLIGVNYNSGNAYSSIQTVTAGVGYKPLVINSIAGNVGIGTTNPRQLLDIYSTGDATVTIRAGGENRNSILYLGTPLNTDPTNGSALKVALIAEGGSLGYSRAKLHFCLNSYPDNRYPTDNATIADARMTIKPSGEVGIGTTNPSNVLQVGGGGRLRIANNNTDYTVIGANDTDVAINTKIKIWGHVSSGLGRIEYYAITLTGSHDFYNNDFNTVSIISDDIQMKTSVTTYGNNYYTDGEYIPYTTKNDSGGNATNGYFIFCGYFFNSLVNISVSHNSTSYTYWAGHMYCNNSGQPITVTQLSSASMVFTAFQEQGGNWWIRCYPSVSFNASTLARVKFYG